MPGTVAVVHADLERTPLGTRSRVGAELGGRPLLRLTIERILEATQLSGCVVTIPQDQGGRCSRLLEALPATVQTVSAAPTGWSLLVQTARKWSLDGWRGGVGGTTSLDEYFHPAVVQSVMELTHADRVMVFPPAAPLLDPRLIDAMIAHHGSVEDEARMTFTQAAPGAAGVIYNADLVRELVHKGIPPGWIFSYKPDAPRKDMAFFSCCFDVRAPLRHGALRLIADTDRAFDTVGALFRQDESPDAGRLGRLLLDYEASHVPVVPREIEVELTTEDPFPQAVLRPRGARVGARGPLSLEVVEALARQMGRFDDRLVVLGGFGEPLRHPQFAQVLRVFRESGVYGICVRTSGIDLTVEAMEALIEHRVDVLTVLIDGWTQDVYQAMTTPGAAPPPLLERLVARIDQLEQLKQQHRSVAPILVPEMVKARPTLGDLPAFFDGWIRRLGTVNVAGYSHRAGQLADLSVMSMAPPVRTPCARLRSRCMVLADGHVTCCDQEFRGVHAVGDLHGCSLQDIWNGEAMTRLRQSHRAGDYAGGMPLCAACDEWHRP